MRTVIGIFGKQYRGKSSTARYMETVLPGFRINPLAYPVKEEYANLLGIKVAALETRKKTDATVRSGLQSLGHDRRKKDPFYWITKCLAYAGDMIVDDIRYLNEIEAFSEAADTFYLIKVETPREIVVGQARGNLSNETHVTETELEDFDEYDLLIRNEGSLDDLRTQALWAAHDVLFSIGYRCSLAQRDCLDEFMGVTAT
jgi:hypothetical protein